MEGFRGFETFETGNSKTISFFCPFFNQKGELAIYYEMDKSESTQTRGIVEVCPETNRSV